MNPPKSQESSDRVAVASAISEAARTDIRTNIAEMDRDISSGLSRSRSETGSHDSGSVDKSGDSQRRRQSPRPDRSLSQSRSRSRSRRRSYTPSPPPPSAGQNSGRPRSSTHSQSDSIRSRSRSRSRRRSPDQYGPHSTEHERHSMSSLRSRAPSSEHDAPAKRPQVTFTNSTRTEPTHERVPGSSNKRVYLNRDDPGDWVIRHHRDGLVVRLEEHKPHKFRFTLDGMRESLLRTVRVRRVGDTGDGEGDEEEATKKAKKTDAAASTSGDGLRFRISFAEVQRMKIRKLQCQLVRHVVKMRETGHESRGWEETLEQYIKALQDHDYMEKRSESARDPFLATGEYALDNYVLNSNIDPTLAFDDTIESVGSILPWEPNKSDDPLHRFEPICGTRSGNIARRWYMSFRDRVLLAGLGGAFLIGPMWLMVLHNGELTGLIATTGFVAVFGIVMAYFLEEGKDVLASTAAYAAVLVVFVGTSTSSPSPESA